MRFGDVVIALAQTPTQPPEKPTDNVPSWKEVIETDWKKWLYPGWTPPPPTPLEDIKDPQGSITLAPGDVKELEELMSDCTERARLLGTTSEALDAAEVLIKAQDSELAALRTEARLLEKQHAYLQQALTEMKLASEKDQKRIASLEESLDDANKTIAELTKQLLSKGRFSGLTKGLLFAAGIALGAYADR